MVDGENGSTGVLEPFFVLHPLRCCLLRAAILIVVFLFSTSSHRAGGGGGGKFDREIVCKTAPTELLQGGDGSKVGHRGKQLYSTSSRPPRHHRRCSRTVEVIAVASRTNAAPIGFVEIVQQLLFHTVQCRAGFFYVTGLPRRCSCSGVAAINEELFIAAKIGTKVNELLRCGGQDRGWMQGRVRFRRSSVVFENR